MIAFFSKWAQGIIVAVILATVIEMILPKGTCKKYVKVVIGMFVLFTIISPIIQVFSKGASFDEIFNLSDYEEIVKQSEDEISQKIEDNNKRSIKDIYVSNLKDNIKSAVESKGYEVDNCVVQVRDNENYTIEKIKITIYKEKNENNNKIIINEININLEDTKNKNDITEEDKNEIKEYLGKTYSVDEDVIEIN